MAGRDSINAAISLPWPESGPEPVAFDFIDQTDVVQMLHVMR